LLFFPEETIFLRDDQEEPIDIRSIITKGSVSFSIRVDFFVGTVKRSVVIDDKGRPFRLTTFNCTGTDRASYRQAHTVDAGRTHVEPVSNPTDMHLKQC
jgi:hypothetical protein